MGIVRSIQKGEAPAGKFSKDAQDAAKKMKKSSVRKYAKTKHDDLPTKKEGVQKDRNELALHIIDLNNMLGQARLSKNPKAKKYIKLIQKDLKDAKKKLSKLKEERDYKAEYKKFQSSTKAKKYRAELNKYNRQKGTYGNGDGKDASHKGGKIVGFEKESVNRGRAEKSRLKKEANMPDFNPMIDKALDEVIEEYTMSRKGVINKIATLAKANRYGTVDGTRMNGKSAKEIIAIYNHPKMKKFKKAMADYTVDDFVNLSIKLKKVLGIKVEAKVSINKKEMDKLHKGDKIEKDGTEIIFKEEDLMNENPAAIAAAQRMVVQNKMGKKVSVMTAKNTSYKEKDPSAHNKAKSIFQRIKDRFKKKNESQMLLQIAKQLKEADESVNEIKVWDVNEACWKGYEKKGMKTMFGKRYPNCVKKTKKKESVDEGSCGYGIDGKLGEEPAGPHLLKKKKKKNMKEASSNDVKRAIQIAKSMGGNMTGAVKKIEKMKRGLTKHKDVRNALKKANEGLADKFMKNIDKYNKKAKKSKDYLKKLKKKKR